MELSFNLQDTPPVTATHEPLLFQSTGLIPTDCSRQTRLASWDGQRRGRGGRLAEQEQGGGTRQHADVNETVAVQTATETGSLVAEVAAWFWVSCWRKTLTKFLSCWPARICPGAAGGLGVDILGASGLGVGDPGAGSQCAVGLGAGGIGAGGQ